MDLGRNLPARGFFLTLEGVDGSGKSTIAGLVAAWLRERGFDVVLTREPGGTPLGQRLRELVLSGGVEMAPLTEALLMAADRAQHVHQVIRPGLAAGRVVVSDRYVDSSFVYQGYAGGVDLGTLRRINEEATGGLYPDLTVILEVEPAEAARRKAKAGLSRAREADRFEARGESFQRKVWEGFRRLAAAERDRIVVLANTGSPEAVAARIGEMVEQRMALRRLGQGGAQ